MGQNRDANGIKHHHHHQDQVVVVAIPLPIQGHLNPLLQLSHLLTTIYHLPVHYLCPATYSRQARLRSHIGSSSYSSYSYSDSDSGSVPPKTNTNKIHFHDLQFFPSLISTPPTHTHPNTKFPTKLQLFLQSSYLLQPAISQLLVSLSSKFTKIIIIHDSLMASVVAQDIKSIPNAESYTFHTSSAFAIFFTIWESLLKKPFELGQDVPKGVPFCQGWSSPEFDKFLGRQYELLSLSSGRLYNTCTSLEAKYVDLLRQLPVNENKKLFAIGPVNPLKTMTTRSKINSRTKHRCLEWLDEQEADSVVYVSFGTTTSMSKEQIKELAIGLDRSEQKFIWVLRDADKFEKKIDGETRGDHDDHQLPKGYEDRMKGRGMVVRDWAPQVEILGHPATGGFVSHCGWNSCMESISMGVPIAAWPLHSDQPKNSFLVTKVLKVGVMVRALAYSDDDEGLVNASVVENAIRRLMTSKEGREIRKRAGELGTSVRGSVARDGTSCLDMDSFVAHITRS